MISEIAGVLFLASTGSPSSAAVAVSSSGMEKSWPIGMPPGIAQVVASPSIWKPFTSAAGQFSVLFPGEPRTLKRATPYAKGQSTDLHVFYVERSQEATTYIVTYNDFSVGLDLSPDRLAEAFNKSRDRLVGTAKLVSEREIDLTSFPGREFKFLRADGQVTRTRLYYARGRLYQVLVTTRRAQDLAKSIDGFFNSFQIRMP
jgi:hypothetical protein